MARTRNHFFDDFSPSPMFQEEGLERSGINIENRISVLGETGSEFRFDMIENLIASCKQLAIGYPGYPNIFTVPESLKIETQKPSLAAQSDQVVRSEASNKSNASGIENHRARSEPGQSFHDQTLSLSQDPLRVQKKNEGVRRRRGGGNRPPQGRPKLRRGQSSRRRSFACPYYHYDNETHGACLSNTLGRIVDVRQHLFRWHVQPSHCPSCGEIFLDDPDHAQLDAHTSRQTCEVTTFIQPLGATHDQLGRITTAADTRQGSSDPERWYIIWDILFPNSPRPSSPYIDNVDTRCRLNVRAAIEQYRELGGILDFQRRYLNGADVAFILDDFLNHLVSFRGSQETIGEATAATPVITSIPIHSGLILPQGQMPSAPALQVQGRLEADPDLHASRLAVSDRPGLWAPEPDQWEYTEFDNQDDI
ncbi:hypothetical protein F5Y16DRAFT_65636 [Xylariaceae sp. FL0255]|nr:hypothetical protein F5Y16DRAFT_65636 [Xylariaceae sp. FL0255]